MNKRSLRDEFRTAVFKRDKNTCMMCGHKPERFDQLDAHHIINRNYMPFGGYCAANGISLCTDRCKTHDDCHHKAECLHTSGFAFSGYDPTSLYVIIKSSYKLAYLQSLKLEMNSNDADIFMENIKTISEIENKICDRLGESPNPETWELTCDELYENRPLIRAYGKGRYVSDD